MKKIYLLLFATFYLAFLSAQVSGNQEVTGSSGGQFKTSQGSLNFTVGEVGIHTYSADTLAGIGLTQGFHQTYFQITEVTENLMEDFQIRVWPNPTLRYLNIDLGYIKEVAHIKAEILDISGVKLELFNVVEKPQVDLNTYPVSSYFLRIYDSKSMRVRMFKIIKL